jgi:hypothetical protein
MSTPANQPTPAPNPPRFSGHTGRSHHCPLIPDFCYWRLTPTSDTLSIVSTAAPSAQAPATGATRSLTGIQSILEEVAESDSSYTDSSSTLFSLYLSHAEKHDREQVDSWKAGADGILVFVRSLPAHCCCLLCLIMNPN